MVHVYFKILFKTHLTLYESHTFKSTINDDWKISYINCVYDKLCTLNIFFKLKFINCIVDYYFQ